jgi:hypothetical protein
MLSDFLFYKALFPASGGGSSEVSGGATAVVYHVDQDYINLGDESDPMLKISDLTPTAEELNGGFFINPTTSISFEVNPMYAEETEGGLTVITVESLLIGGVMSKEVAVNIFGDESLAGFYCMIASDSDLWYCWEKK